MTRRVATGLWVGSAVVVALLAPARAHACDCAGGPIAQLHWPLDGATDVPVDTPIVVWRYDLIENAPENIAFTLTDDEGTEVQLVQTLHLPPAWEGCGEGATTFLRPMQPLEPDATYTFAASADIDPKESVPSTFTTGDGTFQPEASLTPEVTYLRVTPPGTCADEWTCPLGEVLIDFGAIPALPRWVEIQSGDAQYGRNRIPLWDTFAAERNRPMEPAHQLSLVLPADDACVDIRVYGLEGRALFDDRRCEPDRCAKYGRVNQSMCGGLPSSGLDATQVPDGSCDDPPLFEPVQDAGPRIVEDAAMTNAPAAGAPTTDADTQPTFEPTNTNDGMPTGNDGSMPSATDPTSSHRSCAMSAPHSASGIPAMTFTLGLLFLSRRRQQQAVASFAKW